jgi:aminoglycoside phosphotransferase (APT) family kinase protein
LSLIVAKMGTDSDFKSSLSTLFTGVFGADAKLESFKRLSGGASQETWALTGSGLEAILRRAPGGVSTARSSAAIDLPTEAILIEARPILRNDEFSEARARLAGQCGTALAGIHQIALETLPDLPKSDGLAQVAQYEDIYRSYDTPRPIFELAISWLKANAPATKEFVLVHGDFRLGNLMVDEEGLAAVLDWELAHLGDPREDLAWICVNSWRFGQSQSRVGGFGQLDDMLATYNSATGQNFTPKDIDWWEMLGTLKWGVMCMIMYEAFRSGGDPSVERAAIGRRVSETEIDLVNLLEAQRA